MDWAGLTDRLQRISEVYAIRFDIDREGDWVMLKLQEEVGELTQAYLAATGRSRRTMEEGTTALGPEIADVICMALLLAHRHGVDVGSAIETKWLVHPEYP